MQFYRDGTLFKVVRITGPTHNLLCAEIVIGNESIAKIECLPIRSNETAILDPDEVLREVQAGLHDASKRLGICFTAKRVQFLPSDSLPVEVYRSMADALADHFANELLSSEKGSNV